MGSVVTRLQETGQHLARRGSGFVSRTRNAGQSFVAETRDAGLQLAAAVQSEARKWRRFALQRAAELGADVRSTLSMPAAERTVLSGVDHTLQAVRGRVRALLAQLEKPAKASRRSTGRKGGARARKTRHGLSALAA